MGRDDHPGSKVDSVKDLQLPCMGVSRVSKVAMVVVTGEGYQSGRVGWSVSNGVDDLHIPYVVDIERFFQANHQPLEEEKT